MYPYRTSFRRGLVPDLSFPGFRRNPVSCAWRHLPLAFLQSWWFHVTTLFFCASVCPRNMKNHKSCQIITKVGLVSSKWDFNTKCEISILRSHAYEGGATWVVYWFSLFLPHLYTHIYYDPMQERDSSRPYITQFHTKPCFMGPVTSTPIFPSKNGDFMWIFSLLVTVAKRLY
jgi:hypothetical protein